MLNVENMGDSIISREFHENLGEKDEFLSVAGSRPNFEPVYCNKNEHLAD